MYGINPIIAFTVVVVACVGVMLLYFMVSSTKIHKDSEKGQQQTTAIQHKADSRETQLALPALSLPDRKNDTMLLETVPHAALLQQKPPPGSKTMPLALPETPQPFVLQQELLEGITSRSIAPRLSLPMRQPTAGMQAGSLFSYSERRTSSEMERILAAALQPLPQSPISSSEQLI